LWSVRGSDGEVDRASAFHFNDPGSNPGLDIGIFLQDFIISATLAPSGPLSGESTFHYHQLTDLLNFLVFIMRCLYVSVNEFV
jgi:hypothetical protein